MNQNKREHGFYATEDRRKDPKENFKMINRILEMRGGRWESLCDIGCASGDFLYYIREQHGKEKRLIGIDNFEELLRVAKARVPDCNFLKGDILSGQGLPEEKFDIVCMLGVLSLFDDFKCPFENLLRLAAPGGSVLVFSPFNSNGCRVEHRYSIRGEEPGRLMVYSQQEIGEWIQEKGYQYEFIPFQLTVKLDPDPSNPLRSYTVALADGTNGIVNGIGLWFEQYLLRIST